MVSSIVILLGVATLVLVMSPVSSNYQLEDNDFELVVQTKIVSADVPILKYRSKKTGLHVIIVKTEGPTVEGYFTLATEAEDDDGLPHTLEHLVFLGSEDYPYKGVLALLANRCVADGTNAWTEIDHTAYTVKTAGSAGFLNFLPIYLEHLLYPTLTEAGFITEVYHVTGEGHDAGVVYSEMQARENTGTELTYFGLSKLLYPKPSGYRYETGGKMENLRTSTSHKKVVDYHKATYRPENLHVIIVGQVEPKEVFNAMRPIENKIVSKGDRPPFVRPWQSAVPSFNASEEVELVYASDDEANGIVRFGWRGPSLLNNISESQSVNILMKYLTDLSVSPLPKIFVEVKEPLASQVSKLLLENSVTSCIISFMGVPTNKINEVKPLLMKTLKSVADQEDSFQLEVMKNILRKEILKEDNLMETKPHQTVAQNLISDILFGNTTDDLNKYVNKKAWLEHLIDQPSSYWTHLMKKYFTSSPMAVVKGIPSKLESIRIQKENQLRVDNRRKTLGVEGLKKLKEQADEAKRINEIPPPNSMLQTLPVASVNNINFHSLKVYSNIKGVLPEDVPTPNPSLMNLKSVPIKMQLDDIKSNFVEMVAIMDTSLLDPNERKYLELVTDLLLESSMQVEGKTINYEDVIKGLNSDTVTAKMVNGLSSQNTYFLFGSYINYICVNIKVEMPKYERGVYWLKNILNHVVLDIKRVKIKANKLLNSIGDHKRSGTKMLSLMTNEVVFKADTNPNRINALRQEKFLKQLMEDAKKDPERIISVLNKVYKAVTDPDRVLIHMASDLEKLSKLTNVTAPWIDFYSHIEKPLNFSFHPVADHELVNDFDSNGQVTGYVAGLGSLESAFIHQTAKSIIDYNHEDVAPLMVAISYLTQLEGPMWREIRGKGLAYGYAISLKPNEGTLSLSLIRAAQVVAAYEEAHTLINRYLTGEEPYNSVLFESAQSSLLYEVIDRESEVSEVMRQSLLAYYRKVPCNYNRLLLEKIANVTISEMARAAKQHLTPMIDPMQSKTIIVCPQNKAKDVKIGLEKLGHSMEIIDSLQDSHFA